jgi:hypothetical protein
MRRMENPDFFNSGKILLYITKYLAILRQNGPRGKGMEINEALHQLSEIHTHLAKSAIYRDYRALPVTLSGVVALTAAGAQPLFIGEQHPETSFVLYWAIVAVAAALTGGGGILWRYLLEDSPHARRRTRTVLGQFLPSIAAGVLIAIVFSPMHTGAVVFLPGLWAILFSLGIFSSRLYLPRIIGFAALFYLIAGGILLTMAASRMSLSPWGMGLTFGCGQIFSGLALYWNLERKKAD